MLVTLKYFRYLNKTHIDECEPPRSPSFYIFFCMLIQHIDCLSSTQPRHISAPTYY